MGFSILKTKQDNSDKKTEKGNVFVEHKKKLKGKIENEFTFRTWLLIVPRNDFAYQNISTLNSCFGWHFCQY